MHYVVIIVILALLAPAAYGDDMDEDSALSPQDMDADQRGELMQGAAGYNRCVYTKAKAMAIADSDEDIRRLADAALTHCEQQLEALHSTIKAWGFAENFAAHFVRSTKNRVARKLLAELFVSKSY